MNLKSVLMLFTGVCLMMCVPLMAMYFTEEVRWGVGDFVLAGSLLFATALSVYYIIVTIKGRLLRRVLIIGVIMLLIIIWLELAVGIFGSPFAGY